MKPSRNLCRPPKQCRIETQRWRFTQVSGWSQVGLPNGCQPAENALPGDDRHHIQMDRQTAGLGQNPRPNGHLLRGPAAGLAAILTGRKRGRRIAYRPDGVKGLRAQGRFDERRFASPLTPPARYAMMRTSGHRIDPLPAHS